MVTYRPQSNIAERVNRNIVRLISAYVGHFHRTWDQHLHEFAFALRTAKHDSTGKTPAEIFLGRKIITPLYRVFYAQEREAEFAMADIENLMTEVRKSNDKARATQKRYYDQKRRDSELKVGDFVLKITHALSIKQENTVGKFCPKFEGPYTIVKRSGNVVHLDDKGQITVANIDQVKIYHKRESMPLFQTAHNSNQLLAIEASPPQSRKRPLAPTPRGNEGTAFKSRKKSATKRKQPASEHAAENSSVDGDGKVSRKKPYHSPLPKLLPEVPVQGQQRGPYCLRKRKAIGDTQPHKRPTPADHQIPVIPRQFPKGKRTSRPRIPAIPRKFTKGQRTPRPSNKRKVFPQQMPENSNQASTKPMQPVPGPSTQPSEPAARPTSPHRRPSTQPVVERITTASHVAPIYQRHTRRPATSSPPFSRNDLEWKDWCTQVQRIMTATAD